MQQHRSEVRDGMRIEWDMPAVGRGADANSKTQQLRGLRYTAVIWWTAARVSREVDPQSPCGAADLGLGRPRSH
jgi:hypothetical protein